MGTTGTITGVSRFLKERNPQVQIVGAQPEEGSSIAGIRKWPPEYLPAIYRHAKVDRLEYVSQHDAEEMARQMAAREGIFCGISAAGACLIALRVAEEHRERMAADPSLAPATIVFVVCDRGDRYLSTGVFPG
jgi:cysteine synthase B